MMFNFIILCFLVFASCHNETSIKSGNKENDIDLTDNSRLNKSHKDTTKINYKPFKDFQQDTMQYRDASELGMTAQ